jgi:anti-sigma B factor antagonist
MMASSADEPDREDAMEPSQQWSVVPAEGELDLYAAPALRDQLLSAVNNGKHFLVLDLSAVTFIDSSGFAVLVGALKRVRAYGGGLRVVGADASVQSSMRISGLDRVITMYPDLDAALADGPEPQAVQATGTAADA